MTQVNKPPGSTAHKKAPQTRPAGLVERKGLVRSVRQACLRRACSQRLGRLVCIGGSHCAAVAIATGRFGQAELLHHVRQARGLLAQRLGGGGGLFHQRRVLLRHAVDLAHRAVHLANAGRLLGRCTLLTMSFVAMPASFTWRTPPSTAVTLLWIRPLMSLATACCTTSANSSR